MLFDVFCFLIAINEPNRENIIVSPRNNQDIGVLCVSKNAPIAKNSKQRIRVEIIPVKLPQSKGSRPLFFLVAINPPKKADEYMAKNESADM